MMGPWAYASHLMSTPRLPFTATYFGSIALTLYFSLGVSITFSRRTTSDPANMLPTAPKLDLNLHIIAYTAGLLDLVLG